jgi:hypothetical protein
VPRIPDIDLINVMNVDVFLFQTGTKVRKVFVFLGGK